MTKRQRGKNSKKNRYTPLKKIPDRNSWSPVVSNLQYRRLNTLDLPLEVQENELTKKFNSAVVAASGSTEFMVFSVIGIRPDRGNVIDEHPMIYYYDNYNPQKNFGGIIHHGDWTGRTTDMTEQQIDAIEASGITAAFSYKEIPVHGSGSLEDLHKKGMLSGLSTSFNIIISKK